MLNDQDMLASSGNGSFPLSARLSQVMNMCRAASEYGGGIPLGWDQVYGRSHVDLHEIEKCSLVSKLETEKSDMLGLLRNLQCLRLKKEVKIWKAHLGIAAHRWHHFLQRVLFSKPVDLQDIRQGWLHVASFSKESQRALEGRIDDRILPALLALGPAGISNLVIQVTTPSTLCAAELRHAAFSFQPLSAMKDA